nr:MAG TPA: hypothetical protein [Caudoviricetes sp.]
MDRVPDYESVGWGFEPLMAHHKTKALKMLYFSTSQGFFYFYFFLYFI